MVFSTRATRRRIFVVAALFCLVVTAAMLLGVVSAMQEMREDMSGRFPSGGPASAEGGIGFQNAQPHQIPALEAPEAGSPPKGPEARRPHEVGPSGADDTSRFGPHPPRHSAEIQALGQRLVEAVRLGQAAQTGNAAAVAAARARQDAEPDPRIRQALATGEAPFLGEFHPRAPSLPVAAKAAEPGQVDAYWLTPDRDGTYQSKITIDASGKARVETVMEGSGNERWVVRYEAWAWRDAAGNLVIDSRGQQVDLVEHPPAWLVVARQHGDQTQRPGRAHR